MKNPTLREILETGRTTDLAGQTHAVPDTISAEEANILITLVQQVQPQVSLETGTAFGVAALTICVALAGLAPQDPPRLHYGVDPTPLSRQGGGAPALLRRADLEVHFTLLEGPAYLQLPDLLAAGVQLDFAFIDGRYTFDYKLLDFFYIDKMLRPGGIVVFHDYLWPSTQRVVRFALTHRRYQFRREHRHLFAPVAVPRRVARVARAVARRAGRTLVASQWTGLWGVPSMAILTKRANYEPNYDYFVPF